MASTNISLKTADQYSDNVSAEIWDLCIGDLNSRFGMYRRIITEKLRSNQCQHVLDVSCGTGTDSIMLLEEGFRVTSIDISHKMLYFAQEKRWERRKEPGFDSWVIKSANWLTLKEDLVDKEGENVSFDAIICIGNSFPVLDGPLPQRQLLKIALGNMAAVLKPGGILIIDHLNFEAILDEKGGKSSKLSLYQKGTIAKVSKNTLVYENGQPTTLKKNYIVDVNDTDIPLKYHKYHGKEWEINLYPHRLNDFQELLREVFGQDAKYDILGDYKAINQSENPSMYIHFIEKPR